MANFIKLFWHNLRCYRHIALSFDSGYAAWGVNYTQKKVFLTLTPYILLRDITGLYYKHVTIVNDASSGVKKLKASLNDAARGVIYDRHVFIIQATDVSE